MMSLLTFCVLVNSERLLFHKFNFEFKLLLQEIFPLQKLNKTALNKNISTTKCTKSVKILYRQFMPKQQTLFEKNKFIGLFKLTVVPSLPGVSIIIKIIYLKSF